MKNWNTRNTLMTRLFTSSLLTLGLAGCGGMGVIEAQAGGNTENTPPTILELAINKPKDGKAGDFTQARAAFIDVLQQEKDVLDDGKWRTFFHFIEGVKPEEVLVGVTEWSSIEAFQEAAQKLLPQAPAKNYFATFDQIAYVQLKPVDNESFDLESIKQPGRVVEFAVRKAKTDDAFTSKRDDFFGTLPQYDGFMFDREFEVIGQDGVQAVIIVWESKEQFMAAAQPIFASQSYKDFADSVEAQAYQATQYEQ